MDAARAIEKNVLDLADPHVVRPDHGHADDLGAAQGTGLGPLDEARSRRPGGRRLGQSRGGGQDEAPEREGEGERDADEGGTHP